MASFEGNYEGNKWSKCAAFVSTDATVKSWRWNKRTAINSDSRKPHYWNIMDLTGCHCKSINALTTVIKFLLSSCVNPCEEITENIRHKN